MAGPGVCELAWARTWLSLFSADAVYSLKSKASTWACPRLFVGAKNPVLAHDNLFCRPETYPHSAHFLPSAQSEQP